MPKINVFRLVVHEKKIFKYLSKYALFGPLIRTNLNPQSIEILPTKIG